MIWGLSLAHTRAHVYHAIQEGVCYGIANNLRKLADAGYHVDEIVICGGMTKSRDLIQLHADITGVPITMTEVQDAVALGSAMCAAVGAGAYSDLDAAAKAMVHEVDQLNPDPQRNAEYQFYIDEYAAGYPALSEQIHGLVDHLAEKSQRTAD
jgi:sugar (pentulose or hexulose) kinase